MKTWHSLDETTLLNNATQLAATPEVASLCQDWWLTNTAQVLDKKAMGYAFRAALLEAQLHNRCAGEDTVNKPCDVHQVFRRVWAERRARLGLSRPDCLAPDELAVVAHAARLRAARICNESRQLRQQCRRECTLLQATREASRAALNALRAQMDAGRVLVPSVLP